MQTNDEVTRKMVRVSVALPSDVIAAYEREAERRWPGQQRRRGEVMAEALRAWVRVSDEALRINAIAGVLPIIPPLPAPGSADATAADTGSSESR